jgi:hypothetical protein
MQRFLCEVCGSQVLRLVRYIPVIVSSLGELICARLLVRAIRLLAASKVV